MSADLDLVRSIFAAREHGDFGDVAWAHPDIEYAAVDGLEPGTWKGLADLAVGWHGFLSAHEDFATWPTRTASSTGHGS